LLVALAAVPARALPVHAGILPADTTVTPGDTITVSLALVETGPAINGYDATIEYDPAALTLLPLSPTTLQEGGLMKGACANTFHRFLAAGDSAAIAEVLLCAGVSVSGPGQLYKLRFRTSTTPQVTTIRFRPGRLIFYNAGLFVTPVDFDNATIHIGSAVGVGPAVPVPPTLRMAARPNPTRGSLQVEIAGASGRLVELVVQDPAGRIVRRATLESGADGSGGAAGAVAWTWDGRDRAGRAAPTGVYGILALSGGAHAAQRVVLLR
jgi:hypothetical protein